MGEFSSVLVPFALVVVNITLILLAAQRFAWAASPTNFTILSVLALGLAWLCNRILLKWLPCERDPAIVTRVVFSLLILAWGPFMAFHLANIPELESVWIYASPDSLWSRLLGASELSFLSLLQYVAILFSALLATIVFWRIKARVDKQDTSKFSRGWILMALMGIVYLFFAFLLTLPRGSLL